MPLNGGSSVYVMLLDASKAFDRVDYLKLFNLLLKKGMCPIVCRLIVMSYTNQSARTKWGNAYSLPFTIINGVKQGGVLSPILFGIYMDQLFDVLSKSKLGYHIGQMFMGVFGYADDLILVAPTKRSLCGLLDHCLDFSTECKVKFNPAKSNVIVFHNNTNQETSIIFDGQTIISKPQDLHIGNVIGQNELKINILNAKNDIIRRVNVLISYFGTMNTDTKYKLFNKLCMNVGAVYYGTIHPIMSIVSILHGELLDSIRRMFRLPMATYQLRGNCISDLSNLLDHFCLVIIYVLICMPS